MRTGKSSHCVIFTSLPDRGHKERTNVGYKQPLRSASSRGTKVSRFFFCNILCYLWDRFKVDYSLWILILYNEHKTCSCSVIRVTMAHSRISAISRDFDLSTWNLRIDVLNTESGIVELQLVAVTFPQAPLIPGLLHIFDRGNRGPHSWCYGLWFGRGFWWWKIVLKHNRSGKFSSFLELISASGIVESIRHPGSTFILLLCCGLQQ